MKGRSLPQFLQAAMLDEVRAEAKVLYARNDELTSRNVALENQVAEAAASMLRQSQALSLSSPTNVSSVQTGGKVMDEELAQREHVIDVLRTEVHARNIRISELQVPPRVSFILLCMHMGCQATRLDCHVLSTGRSD